MWGYNSSSTEEYFDRIANKWRYTNDVIIVTIIGSRWDNSGSTGSYFFVGAMTEYATEWHETQ